MSALERCRRRGCAIPLSSGSRSGELQRRRCDAELLIESREQLDSLDGVTIRRARRPEPLLSFQHLLPDHDPLLWLPDSFAWSVGAGGDWLRRIGPFVRVVEVG